MKIGGKRDSVRVRGHAAACGGGGEERMTQLKKRPCRCVVEQSGGLRAVSQIPCRCVGGIKSDSVQCARVQVGAWCSKEGDSEQ